MLLSSEHLAPLPLNMPGHDGHDSGGVDDDGYDGDGDGSNINDEDSV